MAEKPGTVVIKISDQNRVSSMSCLKESDLDQRK